MKDGNNTRAEGGEVEGESAVEAGNVNGGNNNQNMTSDEGRATERHLQSRRKSHSGKGTRAGAGSWARSKGCAYWAMVGYSYYSGSRCRVGYIILGLDGLSSLLS